MVKSTKGADYWRCSKNIYRKIWKFMKICGRIPIPESIIY